MVKKKIEQLRHELEELIKNKADGETILKKSQELDRYIIEVYNEWEEKNEKNKKL